MTTGYPPLRPRAESILRTLEAEFQHEVGRQYGARTLIRNEPEALAHCILSAVANYLAATEGDQ